MQIGIVAPKPPVPLTDEERQLLYGQDAKTVRA